MHPNDLWACSLHLVAAVASVSDQTSSMIMTAQEELVCSSVVVILKLDVWTNRQMQQQDSGCSAVHAEVWMNRQMQGQDSACSAAHAEV